LLKTAVLGVGFIGATHAAAHAAAGNITLTAVVDVNEALGKKVADETGAAYYKSLAEMLDDADVDMVDVCVPTWLHEESVIAAVKRGKHVLCEKPVALKLSAFDAMTTACRDNNVQFMAAQVVRFMPEYEKITELYRGGAYGDVHTAFFNRLAEYPRWSTWHHVYEKSGGCLFDLGLHDYDFAIDLFGDAASVHAVGHKTKAGAWMHVCANVKFVSGVSAVFESTYENNGGFPFTVNARVHGSRMTSDFRLTAGHNLESFDTANHSFRLYFNEGEPQTVTFPASDPFVKEIEYFADIIINGVVNDRVSVESSRKTIVLAQAIEESLETGRVVEIVK